MDPWKVEDSSSASGEDQKAWHLLEKIALSSIKEQRRARRWGIFFKSMTLLLMFTLAGLIYQSAKINMSMTTKSDTFTALVDLKGVISDGGEASADKVIAGLQAAFEEKGTKGVILRINSPGGSPVQAGYIYDEIRRLRTLHPSIPLYATISDIGASGGYYVAAAADGIYADKASLVGSIGVISSGFGFVDAMKKLGITRRTYTSGTHKDFMDPFQPMDKEAMKHWQASLETVHQQFIDSVKEGRGDKLTDNPELFSGMVWNGEKAHKLGLIDGLGSSDFVAREIIGAESIVDFTPKDKTLERFAREFGVSFSGAMTNVLGLGDFSLR
ncbi:putative signal peptide peptidase SppA [invertebrate metagenome]|uniref:Putative signal peptide peptidase SppA n=1 Tax=invertebrate metagenome TaxID=1711999 RepID=A0A2H9T8I2_9ZZZZ